MPWTTQQEQAWLDSQVFDQVTQDPGAPAGWIKDRLNQTVSVQAVVGSLTRLVEAGLVVQIDKPQSYPRRGYMVNRFGLIKLVRQKMGFGEDW